MRSWLLWERGEEVAPGPFLTGVFSKAVALWALCVSFCVFWILLRLAHTGGNMSESDGGQQGQPARAPHSELAFYRMLMWPHV